MGNVGAVKAVTHRKGQPKYTMGKTLSMGRSMNLAANHNQKKLNFFIPFFIFQKTPVKLGETLRIWSLCILPDHKPLNITVKL